MLEIEARVRAQARTGVEMEALVAVVGRGPHGLRHVQGGRPRASRIEAVRLVAKRGGKSGAWEAPGRAAGRLPDPFIDASDILRYEDAYRGWRRPTPGGRRRLPGDRTSNAERGVATARGNRDATALEAGPAASAGDRRAVDRAPSTPIASSSTAGRRDDVAPSRP